MTHRDMALEAYEQGVYGDGVSRDGEVMHPISYLTRTGNQDGLVGISPVFPLSPRYMWGYTRGRAIWDAYVALYSG